MSEETPVIIETKSEESPKITKVKKEKDPKSVEAGKRLAAISKAAKERKMRDKIEAENKQDNSVGDLGINYGLLFGAFGIAVAIGSLYYTRKEHKLEAKNHEIVRHEPVTVHEEPKRKEHKPVVNTLDTLE